MVYLSGIPLRPDVADAMYESFLEANVNNSSPSLLQFLGFSLNSGINKAALSLDMIRIMIKPLIANLNYADYNRFVHTMQ